MKSFRWMSLIAVEMLSACFSGNIHSQSPSRTDDRSDVPVIGEVNDALQAFVDSGEIAGAVTLVIHDGKMVHHGAVGLADLESKRPMDIETMFSIASMTKPITSTAVLMLRDEGKLDLDDPVSKYIPQFTETKLDDGSTPQSPITIRQCLTHTAGLAGEQTFQGTLAQAAEEIASRKLIFQTGERWSYSPGITIAGRIVEVVSGMPFESFLQKRIFDPLAMNDTTFFPNEKTKSRMAGIYNRDPKTGKLIMDQNRFVKIHGSAGPNPSAGLLSTAHDMGKFYQCMLDGGRAGERTILAESSVKEMTSLETGSLETGFTPGNGWGLGWCVIQKPKGVSETLSSGTFGHGGAFGTQGWVDPVSKTVHVLMIQRTGLPNSDASDIRRDFHRAVSVALDSKNRSSSSVAVESSKGHWTLLGGQGRLALTNPKGEVRWQIPWNDIHDIHLTEDNLILTRQGGSKVVKVDPKTKQVVWTYDAHASDDRPLEIHAFEALEDGRVMVAESGRKRLVLVRDEGTVDDEIPLTVDSPNQHSDTRLVRQTRDGGFLVAHENDGKVRRYDGQGNVTWEYSVPMFDQEAKGGHGPEAFGNRLFAAIELANGNTLVATGNGHSVLEVTPQKEIVWQIHQKDLPGIVLAWVTTLEVTPEGTYLIGNCHAGPGQPTLVEVDPATKKVLWQLNGHDDFGNSVSNSTRIPIDQLEAFGIPQDEIGLE
jgi:CubicO group peptidase (beta-lactamase class C family)